MEMVFFFTLVSTGTHGMLWFPPQVAWLAQLVMTTGAVFALLAGQRADTRNFHECLGLQHSEVQMCMFILSPEGPCKYTVPCLYL